MVRVADPGVAESGSCLSSTRRDTRPTSLVITRAREGIANHFLDAHARAWITTRDAGLIRLAGALNVFAERELDPRHRSGKKNSLAGRPYLIFTTVFNPPIGLAEPCRRFKVVTPPASSR